MKTTSILALSTILIVNVSAADTVNFDDLKTGAAPPGWTATKTGKGDPRWEVVATIPPPANLRSETVRRATYPVCIKDDTTSKTALSK